MGIEEIKLEGSVTGAFFFPSFLQGGLDTASNLCKKEESMSIKLNKLFQRYVSMGVRDYQLELKIRSELKRINLNIPGIVEPNLEFARKIEKLFLDALSPRELDYDTYIVKEEVSLYSLQKHTQLFYVGKKSDETLKTRISNQLLNESTYKYTYLFSNLGLENCTCRSKNVVVYKSDENPILTLCVFDTDNEEYCYNSEILEETFTNPVSINSFVQHIRRYSIQGLLNSSDRQIFSNPDLV